MEWCLRYKFITKKLIKNLKFLVKDDIIIRYGYIV